MRRVVITGIGIASPLGCDYKQATARLRNNEHGIVADIEMIPMQDIDHAYDRMQKSEVKYRFVIDNATLAR